MIDWSKIEGDLGIEVDLGTGNVPISILFPSLTISNENGQSHQIEDLYVFFLENHVYGMRGTLIYEEAIAGYMHSHLTSFSVYQDLTGLKVHISKGSFCLGSSTIGTSLHQFYSGAFTNDHFGMYSFLYGLKMYLQYESLKGGPHIKIQAIGKTRFILNTNRVTEQEHLDVITPMLLPLVKTKITEGVVRFEVPLNIEGIELPYIIRQRFCCTNVNGSERFNDNSVFDITVDMGSNLTFKTKPITTIIKTREVVESTEDTFLSKIAKKKIEHEIRKRWFTSSTFRGRRGRNPQLYHKDTIKYLNAVQMAVR